MNSSVSALKWGMSVLELLSCLTAHARRILIIQNKVPGSFIKFTSVKFKFLLIFPASSLPLCALSAVSGQTLQPQPLAWLLPPLLALAPAACSVPQPPLLPTAQSSVSAVLGWEAPRTFSNLKNLPITLVINSQILTVK